MEGTSLIVAIAAGVFLSGLGIPWLAEVLLPYTGLAVREGNIGLGTALLIALSAQMAGMIVAYWIARLGGITVIERYGKLVFITHREIRKAQRVFERYGGRLVLAGSFIPGVQGVVGYAAGLSRMRPIRFVTFAFLGKLVWVCGLVWLGIILGNQLETVDQSVKQVGMVVLASLAAAGTWQVKKRRQRRKAQ